MKLTGTFTSTTVSLPNYEIGRDTEVSIPKKNTIGLLVLGMLGVIRKLLPKR